MTEEKLRHSTAHILAYAIKLLYPKVKLGIGPSIENGFYYDFDNLKIAPSDLNKIEDKMKELIQKNLEFKKIKVTKEKVKQILKDEPYKLDLLKEIKDPIFYKCGDFTDLCAGPHITSTKEIKAFKLTKIAGAYWKGDSKNKMLTRIYGVAFKTEKELKDYLFLLEEAEKRNHIKLGKQLDLFSFHQEAPGFPFWHPKGLTIWNELMKYWREEHKKDYVEIRTPMILNKVLWEQSGHWDHYKENMYFTKIDNQDFAVKPMNCPGGILIYKEHLHSYKELPLRMAEVGLVHRHELSGVLNGLFRVRAFFQDDAHIYCTEEQIKNEVIKIIQLVQKIYKTFNLEYHIELSTKPTKAIGTKNMWDTAEKALKQALEEIKIKYKINPEDGAFYGPKIDFHIKDSLNRTWQCATIQLDFAMPSRFDLTYEGKDGKKHTPVMLHRTVYGGIERFIGILIEHFGGKFPLWLAPVQVAILPVSDKHIKYSNNVKGKFEEKGIRTVIDERQETIPKKVHDIQLQKIPIVIVIGDKEIQNKNLTIRTLNGKLKTMKDEELLESVKEDIEKRKC